MGETQVVSREGWRLFIMALAVIVACLVVAVFNTASGVARVLAIVFVLAAFVGAMVRFAWVTARRPPPHADPNSRVARFDHWLDESTPEPSDRYCPRCARRRLSMTPLNYLPPTPAENRLFCTPWSCQWYDEPSIPAPPH